MPQLNGKLNGQAIRVPTANVSIVDLTVTLKNQLKMKLLHEFLNAKLEN